MVLDNANDTVPDIYKYKWYWRWWSKITQKMWFDN